MKTILLDSSGLLWVGTGGGGLNRFDRKTETCIHYRNDPHNPKSLNNNSILSLCEDKDGTLWIGTNGGGLNTLDKSSEAFQHYTKEHGLPNNVVYGIVQDDDGSLWLSTNNGISRFDPEAETFRNYTVDDGLQSNEFNYNAFYQSASGELFFGGINGLNFFFPTRVTDNPITPQTVMACGMKKGYVARRNQQKTE